MNANEKLNDAFADIDAEHIASTQAPPKSVRFGVKRSIALVACLATIFTCIGIWVTNTSQPISDVSEYGSETVGESDSVSDYSVPAYNNAQFSASDVAALFNADKLDNEGATKAYTTFSIPAGEAVVLNEIPQSDELPVYNYKATGKPLNLIELNAFASDLIPGVNSALGIEFEQPVLKENNAKNIYRLFCEYYSDSEPDEMYDYYLDICQYPSYSYVSIGKIGEDRYIYIDGTMLCVDQTQTDEEIAASVEGIRKKLCAVFGVDFTDVRIERKYGTNYSEYGVEYLYVYFYPQARNKDTESDYICITFDNFMNYSGDMVSKTKLCVPSISYKAFRTDSNETYAVAGSSKRISLEEAEQMLFKGYVFGGHSCELCMQMQTPVDFKGYDKVGMAYLFGKEEYGKEGEKDLLGLPFYVFVKKINTTSDGLDVYAKTYVPAIQISGIEEYFENQKANHKNNDFIEVIP